MLAFVHQCMANKVVRCDKQNVSALLLLLCSASRGKETWCNDSHTDYDRIGGSMRLSVEIAQPNWAEFEKSSPCCSHIHIHTQTLAILGSSARFCLLHRAEYLSSQNSLTHLLSLGERARFHFHWLLLKERAYTFNVRYENTYDKPIWIQIYTISNTYTCTSSRERNALAETIVESNMRRLWRQWNVKRTKVSQPVSSVIRITKELRGIGWKPSSN